MGRGGRLRRLASQVGAAVSAGVCLPARRKQRAGRLPSTDAPGLTPPPGAHWPAPPHPPHPRPVKCRGLRVSWGWWRRWSVASLQPQAWPLRRGGAASPQGKPGWAGAGPGEGEGRRGTRRALGPGVTDSRGSRRARILRAHTHTPRCRDPRPPTAGGQTDAETRARGAHLGTRALHPPAARGTDSPLRAIPAESAQTDPSGSR